MRRLTATAATLAALGLSVGPAASAVPSPAGPSTYATRPGSSPTHRAAVVPAKDVAVVVLDTLTPAVVGPGKDVTITGTVTAPLTGPLSGPEVRVVRGDVAVNQRSALDDWATGRTETSGRTVDTTSLATVAAGQTQPFTATVPWERLRSDDAFAALPISVEVVQEGASEPTGMTRTFIAWNGRKEYVPLKVATVLPVTLPPTVALAARDDAARLAAWEQAIGPDSRVARILEGTRGTPVDLAVDPSVLGPDLGAGSGTTGPTPSGTSTPGGTGTTAPAPSGTSGTPAPSASGATGTTGTPAPAAGTSAPAPDGTTQTPSTPPTTSTPPPAGTPSEATLAIARLGDDVVTQLSGRSVWALPYADADVAATVGVDPVNSLVRDLVSRASTLAGRLGQPARADIVWPVDGLLPAGREQGIKTLLSGTTVRKPAGIVVNAAAVTKETAYTPTARRVTASGTRLLAYNTRLSALLPKRTDPSPVLSVQRYLAETLVLLGERAGTPRSVLVTAPRTYDPDAADLATFLAATSSAPWLETVDAASLLTDSGNDKAVPQTRPTTAVASAAPKPVLNARRLARMADQRDTLLSVSSVLRDGEEFERTYREVLDGLASARWRWNPAGWVTLANSVDADIKAATSAIRVVPRTSTINLLAENGTLRITVENGLDYTVENIRLRLVPDNPRIRIVEQPDPVTIGPSSRTNVPVEVAAVAAGRAEIRAFLTTADGTQIGSPATIPVSANPLDAAIYWVGGILVGLVLLAGVIRAVVKGTSRVDEIADIEAVTAAHEALGDADDRDHD
ncbi:DUF6049 family protein [Terrabacter sp. 2TAF16]|uniref:DUF6049 family protein n=1 Tax=Terrabacter sp. 2TAF16 TaxID=3233008 RepID=UPI003F94B665